LSAAIVAVLITAASVPAAAPAGPAGPVAPVAPVAPTAPAAPSLPLLQPLSAIAARARKVMIMLTFFHRFVFMKTSSVVIEPDFTLFFRLSVIHSSKHNAKKRS
jgi:hypothetical protein